MFYGLLFRNMLLLFRRNRFALVALMLAVLGTLLFILF